MLKSVSKMLIVGLVLSLTTACANVSSLQTAQTLPAGKGEVTLGGGYFTMPDVNKAASDATNKDTEIKAPYAEVQYRRGIAENFDMGLKLTLIGTLALDGKYRFLNSGGFAMATGLGVGYVSIESGSGDTKIESTIVDVTIPLHTSYNISDGFALYLSPKYVMRSTESLTHLVGTTVGARVGSDWGFYIETSYLVNLDDTSVPVIQVNGALFW